MTIRTIPGFLTASVILLAAQTTWAQDGAAGATEEAGAEEGEASPLDSYATNLNEEAAAGRIDPLIGRSAEVERVIQVLARRRKNNPLLVGESGVGKTAIAEGLANRIVAGDVPETLKGKRILALDLGAMLAGTRHAPDEVIGRMRPTSTRESWQYTVEKVAVNAVMAGAKPEYLPVILALAASQVSARGSTTSSTANMVVVNGPIRREIGMNWGIGAMGPFNRANATIGIVGAIGPEEASALVDTVLGGLPEGEPHTAARRS